MRPAIVKTIATLWGFMLKPPLNMNGSLCCVSDLGVDRKRGHRVSKALYISERYRGIEVETHPMWKSKIACESKTAIILNVRMVLTSDRWSWEYSGPSDIFSLITDGRPLFKSSTETKVSCGGEGRSPRIFLFIYPKSWSPKSGSYLRAANVWKPLLMFTALL